MIVYSTLRYLDELCVIKENKESIRQLKKIWNTMQTIQDILFSTTVNLKKIVAKDEDKGNYSEDEEPNNS